MSPETGNAVMTIGYLCIFSISQYMVIVKLPAMYVAMINKSPLLKHALATSYIRMYHTEYSITVSQLDFLIGYSHFVLYQLMQLCN